MKDWEEGYITSDDYQTYFATDTIMRKEARAKVKFKLATLLNLKLSTQNSIKTFKSVEKQLLMEVKCAE